MRALITGITGQDGSYLAELLLEKGYHVSGIIRRSSQFNTGRLDHIYNHPNLKLHYGDLSSSSDIYRLIDQTEPDEVYNLAAQSHVKVSFETPEYTSDITAVGVIRVLDAIKSINPKIRFYQASSSEMYGKVLETPQKESTPFYPRSPYGCAKVFGYWATVNYREAYGLHASNGILFNHESPRRGETFVTRKITKAVAKIVYRRQEKLLLGNLTAIRDWGHAKDYVRAMWLMLQHATPDDYVISTGETHSVKDVCEIAFNRVGLNWKDYVQVDPKYNRPTEVDILMGDSTKARAVLGWTPEYTFTDLINEMVDEDLKHESR